MADLLNKAPRRWNETLAGYVWLPRLIDKVRAHQAGTLGTYAYPSMLDQVFLRRCRLSPAELEMAVRNAKADEDVGAYVRSHTGHTPEQIQTDNERFERQYRWPLTILDQDDGYTSGPGYPFPSFLQPVLWRAYQRWCGRKASATRL